MSPDDERDENELETDADLGDEGDGEEEELSDDGIDGDAEAEGGVPSVSRKIRRRRRRTRPRSKTIAMKRLTREELRQGALMYPPADHPRGVSRRAAAVPVGRLQAPPLSRHQPGDRVDQDQLPRPRAVGAQAHVRARRGGA